jgi:hypothetical protein
MKNIFQRMFGREEVELPAPKPTTSKSKKPPVKKPPTTAKKPTSTKSKTTKK